MSATKADAAAYARGYQAGRRKASQDAAATLWLRTVEVSLPYFLGANNWTRGAKKLTTVPDRVSLATEAADRVLEEARARGMIA